MPRRGTYPALVSHAGISTRDARIVRLMDIDALRQNWGLLVAIGLMLVVAVSIAVVVYRRSSSGQLRQVVKSLRVAERRVRDARSNVDAAERRLARLRERAASTKPRVVEEAKGALADARALDKIANDQLLIAANHVRRVIYEEFPPTKHEKLRRTYLPGDRSDERPFSF